MFKLYIRHTLTGLMFMGIYITVTAAVMAVFGLLGNALSIPFSAIIAYIVGGLIALACFFKCKRLLVEDNSYFVMPDKEEHVSDFLNKKQKNTFWIDRLIDGKFVSKGAARATYIPCFIFSIGLIVLAALMYGTLQKADNYIGFTVVSGIIGASALGWMIYGIAGIKSIAVCKKCRKANAFVFDEYVDLIAASGFNGNVSYNSGVKHRGVTFGGWYVANRGRVTKYGDMISRHCACCGEKSAHICNLTNETNVIQPKNPTKG